MSILLIDATLTPSAKSGKGGCTPFVTDVPYDSCTAESTSSSMECSRRGAVGGHICDGKADQRRENLVGVINMHRLTRSRKKAGVCLRLQDLVGC